MRVPQRPDYVTTLIGARMMTDSRTEADQGWSPSCASKGSGQLKKRVLRFLDRREIKALYHRVEKDADNFGRVFVHLRWK